VDASCWYVFATTAKDVKVDQIADLTPASGWATARIYLSTEELKMVEESGSKLRIIK
jgi:hypothetical protein